MLNKETLLFALALLAGCSPSTVNEPAEQPPEPPVLPSDVDMVTLEPGEKKAIMLRENVTTGFSWHAASDSEMITVAIEHLGPPKTKVPQCGAPGRARVTFEALAGFEGQATVTLRNMRSWDGDTMETRVIKVVPGASAVGHDEKTEGAKP